MGYPETLGHSTEIPYRQHIHTMENPLQAPQRSHSNLMKLAELALIAPLQTADCERGFSTQNNIKTADRNRLSPDRLNKLMKISLH